MTIYLKNDRGDVLFECEYWIKTVEGIEHNKFLEISTGINILHYSQLLVDSIPSQNHMQVINNFTTLNDLRGWLWESWFMGRKNDPNEYNEVYSALRNIIDGAANDLGLYVTID